MLRMLATGHSNNLYFCYGVRSWTEIISLKQPRDIFVNSAFQIHKYKN